MMSNSTPKQLYCRTIQLTLMNLMKMKMKWTTPRIAQSTVRGSSASLLTQNFASQASRTLRVMMTTLNSELTIKFSTRSKAITSEFSPSTRTTMMPVIKILILAALTTNSI